MSTDGRSADGRPSRWTKSRLLVLGALVAVAAGVAGRGVWIPAVGGRLVCEEGDPEVEALVLDNLDAHYGIFKRAAQIQRVGKVGRVFVAAVLGGSDDIDAQIVDLMAHTSGLRHWEVIPAQNAEPVALKAAMRVREVLAREQIGSVAIVSPGFRSHRSFLAYGAVLGDAIRLECIPVIEQHETTSWTHTWHGVQEVALQNAKLEYYRFYVLPRRALGY